MSDEYMGRWTPPVIRVIPKGDTAAHLSEPNRCAGVKNGSKNPWVAGQRRERSFRCYWKEYKVVQPPWKTVLQLLITQTGDYSVAVVGETLSPVRLFVTSCIVTRQASLPFTISQGWLKLMSTESVMPFNQLILCRPLLLSSIFPASGSFPMSQLFASVAKVLDLQLQHQSFQ